MSEPSVGTPPVNPALDRLESWKEIAAYLKRDVTTVQRWEKREAMPVHRHLHDKQGSVYAFRSELDAWTRGRAPRPIPEIAGTAAPEPPRKRHRTALVTTSIFVVASLVGFW